MKTIDDVINQFNKSDQIRHLPPDIYYVELIEYIRENYKLVKN